MSLRWKLVLLVLALTTGLLGGLGAYLGLSLEGWTAEAVDQELTRRARGLTREVRFEHGELEVDDHDLGRRGFPFRIETLDGDVVYGGRVGWPTTEHLEVGFATVEVADGAPLRVLSLRFEPHHGRGQELLLRVAAPLSMYGELVHRIRVGLAGAHVAAIVFGIAGAMLLAHFILRPLRRLSEAVGGIEAHSLGTPLDTRGLDPDLTRLAEAFNGMLGRLAGAFDAQRAFVGRASHALRTPLASILSQAEVALLRDRSPDSYRATLSAIAESARESALLADGLLALTRADAAEETGATKESLGAEELAQELARLFAPRAEREGLRFSASAEPDVVVHATRRRLREMLDALLDNALRYTPKGGEVCFVARREGSEVVLEVADTGLGITPEERTHVFERFFRGSAAARSGQKGSGLGLALVRALAEAEGARLELDSASGGGTRVRLAYPAGAHRRPEDF